MNRFNQPKRNFTTSIAFGNIVSIPDIRGNKDVVAGVGDAALVTCTTLPLLVLVLVVGDAATFLVAVALVDTTPAREAKIEKNIFLIFSRRSTSIKIHDFNFFYYPRRSIVIFAS